jgi:hypothetical protein
MLGQWPHLDGVRICAGPRAGRPSRPIHTGLCAAAGTLEVIGFAHALSNSLTPYFPELVVAAKDRNHSVARKLLAEIFHRSGAIRLDLISTDTAEGFYETLAHHRYAGFRL